MVEEGAGGLFIDEIADDDNKGDNITYSYDVYDQDTGYLFHSIYILEYIL